MSRLCSQCGNNGHNSRTCPDASGGGVAGDVTGSGNGIMLFGVRLMEGGSFRKSASMNNLAQYEQPEDDVAAGYASDDVDASDRSRERKRGVPWTEEEHKLFLLGLQKVGKGDWRGISRNFVKTRTPTQVASHAQKYFLRRTNRNRRRRRSSLFDITTDTYMISTIEEDQIQQEAMSHPHLNNHLKGFPVISTFPAVLPVTGDDSVDNLALGHINEANCSLQSHPSGTCSSVFKNGRSQFEPHTNRGPVAFISEAIHITVGSESTASETRVGFSGHVRWFQQWE
ncbi:myb-like transcription factor family protein [Actinidia rufa]|uniref:Myb-like transcription factor family protein n=1 Tax=Actinidia rufa TaxID=165716 RepID=A0A7J0EQU5_9ERIC|nr:myb-like transcription factor family protein [Actinidia rufa]